MQVYGAFVDAFVSATQQLGLLHTQQLQMGTKMLITSLWYSPETLVLAFVTATGTIQQQNKDVKCINVLQQCSNEISVRPR